MIDPLVTAWIEAGNRELLSHRVHFTLCAYVICNVRTYIRRTYRTYIMKSSHDRSLRLAGPATSTIDGLHACVFDSLQGVCEIKKLAT